MPLLARRKQRGRPCYRPPVRRGLLLRLGAFAFTSLGAAACAPTRTEVVVLIDTDVPRTEMDGYRILVFEPEDIAPSVAETEAVTDRWFPILDEPPFTLPSSFGVAPRDGDAARMVRIVVQGTLTALRDPDTNPFAKMGLQTSVVTNFVDGEVRRLDLVLAAACVGVECPVGQSCGVGGCHDELVDAAALPRWPQRD